MQSPDHSLSLATSFLHRLKTSNLYAMVGYSDDQDSEFSDYLQDRAFRDMVFAKRMISQNHSLVVRRVDWEADKIFDQWLHYDTNLKSKDFYCLTSDNNVYKCLSNNNGMPSTVEPSGVSVNRFQTADGYVWKYLFTVQPDQATAFLTPEWIPVKGVTSGEIGFENQYASQLSAIPGTVDRIDVIQGGSGYSEETTTVTILGDGSGATATLDIHAITGTILGINVPNIGAGYSHAIVVIHDSAVDAGSGALAHAILSPLNGHGENPLKELFVNIVSSKVEVQGDESGMILDDISISRVMIVDSIIDASTFEEANDPAYNNTTKLSLSGVAGSFVVGERYTSGHYSGHIVYIDGSDVYVSGATLFEGTIVGVTSGASATVQTVLTQPLIHSGSVVLNSAIAPLDKVLANTVTLYTLFQF